MIDLENTVELIIGRCTPSLKDITLYFSIDERIIATINERDPSNISIFDPQDGGCAVFSLRYTKYEHLFNSIVHKIELDRCRGVLVSAHRFLLDK